MPLAETAPFFIIAGPTAAGKSELAVLVAERCHGEIVNADAFQIYRGLDLLTAKPAAELRGRVPHHLIGEISPGESFDVARFRAMACGRIAEIHQRGRVPILVGGTGLYLRALTHGIAELPKSDSALRARLDERSTASLCGELADLDPDGWSEIDRQNRRRVIRALEVCLLTGKPFSSFRQQWKEPAAATGVVVDRDRAELHERIGRRTEAMFAASVIEEVRSAADLGATARQTLGWKEIRALLEGSISREQCLAAITSSTRRYAKRQLTWFRRESHLEWIKIAGTSYPKTLVQELAERARAAVFLRQ